MASAFFISPRFRGFLTASSMRVCRSSFMSSLVRDDSEATSDRLPRSRHRCRRAGFSRFRNRVPENMPPRPCCACPGDRRSTRRSVADHLARISCINSWVNNCASGNFTASNSSRVRTSSRLNFLASREAIRQFARLDLHGAIRCVARDDVLHHFIDVQIFVARANARERFVRAESATAATADVIFAEQRALRAGKLLEQLAHGDIGIDRRRQ